MSRVTRTLYKLPRSREEILEHKESFPEEALRWELDMADRLDSEIRRQADLFAHAKERSPELHEYVFTFGFGQKLQNCYCLVYCDTLTNARTIMTSVYGPLWAFSYKDKESAGVEKYGLRLVPFGTQNWKEVDET